MPLAITFLFAWAVGTLVLMASVPALGWPVAMLICVALNVVIWAGYYSLSTD